MRTGRAVYRRKERVEQALSLEIGVLARGGYLAEEHLGWPGCLSWKRGETVTSSVGFEVLCVAGRARVVRFFYSTGLPGEPKRSIDLRVELATTQCHLGGFRWWWICPLVVEGNACGRRCRILYTSRLSPLFGCRLCHELTYKSRQRHRDSFYEGIERPFEMLEQAEMFLTRRCGRRKLFRALGLAEVAKKQLERGMVRRAEEYEKLKERLK